MIQEKPISLPEEIERRHQDAIDSGSHTYEDPETGYVVFTKLFHLERGYCCKSGCRHCPYGFDPNQRAQAGDANTTEDL